MSIREIDPASILTSMQTGEILLVDVREPREYGAERIHGALLHPLSTFDPAALPHDANRQVVLHCGSGKRSADALSRCKAAGVNIDAHMLGGLMAWKQAGLPTIAIDPATGEIRDPQTA